MQISEREESEFYFADLNDDIEWLHELRPPQHNKFVGRNINKRQQLLAPISLKICKVTYHFLNLQSVLEVDKIRSRPVLTIIQQNDHSVRIHRISRVKLPILKRGNDLLGIVLSTLFKGLDTVGVRGSEVGLDFLHVGFQVGQVGLLVKGGGLETHRVDDIIDGLDAIFDAFVGFFGRGIGAYEGGLGRAENA